MNTSLIATGSVLDHAKRLNADLATSFLDVELILLCDRSGSMTGRDAAQGKARYQVEDEIVKDLQRRHEGKILLASFSDYATIHVNGILPEPNGGTAMLDGLKKVLPYCVDDMRVILISDGEPSDREEPIINFAVKNLYGRLDTMFAGPKGSSGEAFLKRLARACNGTTQTNVLNQTHLLTERVNQLLLHAGA